MRIGRSLAMTLVATLSLPCWGCGLTPHSFRKLQPTPATVRARSIGLDPHDNAQAVPALVDRLEDEDPVVRMVAQEELRQRTGQDLGFVAWAGPEERAAAVARWRGWLKSPASSAGSPRTAALPVTADSPRAARKAARRRRNRPQPPAAAAPAPPTPENVSS